MALWPRSQHPPGLLSRVLATAINLAQGQLNCHLTLLPANLQEEFLCIAQAIEQQQKMDFWHEAHGLPSPNSLQTDRPNVSTYAPLSGHPNMLPLEPGNLGVTPPMPLPLVDSHLSMVENTLGTASSHGGQDSFDSSQNWASTSSSSGPGSSPFRHAFNYAQRSIGTVSVQQLHPELSQCLMPPVTDDDMGVFNFSDSDGSLPGTSFQPIHPPSFSCQTRAASQRQGNGMPSQDSSSHYQAHGRQHRAAPSKYEQEQHRHQQHQQQSRRPLPSGPRGSVSSQSGSIQPNGSGHHLTRRLSRSTQAFQKPEPLPILRSNGPLRSKKHPAEKASIPRQVDAPPTPSRARPTIGTSRVPTAPTAASSSSFSSSPSSSSFPPGQDKPGFVPIGKPQVASRAQGNHWPIARDLQVKIIAAERDVDGTRRSGAKLTYKQISAKYSHWRSNESTLRGIKRVHELPREHRERRPTWGDEHIQSLRRALPRCIDSKGRVAWGQIVRHIKDDTGKPFGASTVRKKWEELARSGVVPDLDRVNGQDIAGMLAEAEHDFSSAGSENPSYSDDETNPILANPLAQNNGDLVGGNGAFSTAGGLGSWANNMTGQW